MNILFDPSSKKGVHSKTTRSQKGSIPEFGAAFLVLICFVLLPILNLCFIPVRYMMCEGVLNNLTNRLAHCESFSDAQALIAKDSWHRMFLRTCGVELNSERLALQVSTADGARSVYKTGQLSEEWLPGGANGPCIYSLELHTDCAISALYQGPFKAPVVKLTTHSQWENLAKNPKTLTYFINE